MLLSLRAADLSRYVVYVGFAIIFLAFAIVLSDDGFLSVTNLVNIVQQTTPVTVMAIGMVFVLTAGEIDLSIGSVVAISALIAAVVLREHSWLAGAAAGMGAGLAIGLDQRRDRRLWPAALVPGDAGHHGACWPASPAGSPTCSRSRSSTIPSPGAVRRRRGCRAYPR